MTRILYVITELDVGGAERALVELATRLDRERYAPEVACLAGEGPLAEPLRERGIPVHCLAARGRWDLRVLWRLRKLAAGFDLVHSFLYHANMATRIAAMGSGVGAVVCAARVAERSRPRRRTIECWSHRLVDVEVCVSNGVRDYLGAGGFPRDKLRVIPNGVDVDRFGPRDPELKESLAIAPDVPLITTIGRLHEQKGISYLLRAVSSMRHSRRACHLLIVGHGPLDDELKALAKQFGVADRVTFLGFCDDVPRVLAATDIFVLASLWEGMPNAVLEAMAAGLPVVATRVEGTVDLIDDGKTGMLVMPRDVPGLATSILRLLDDPARARALGKAAQAHVRAHFPLDAMVRRHEQLYAELLRGAAQ